MNLFTAAFLTEIVHFLYTEIFFLRYSKQIYRDCGHGSNFVNKVLIVSKSEITGKKLTRFFRTVF